MVDINRADQSKDIKDVIHGVERLASLVRRAQLYSGLGESFDGDRDVYEALGYPKNLTYTHYANIYSRLGMAKRVNNAPCDAVWRLPPRIYDAGGPDKSPFEKGWTDLVKRLKLWNKMNRVDRLLGFGTYSILLLGFDDVTESSHYTTPVTAGERKLQWVQCYSSEYATINKLDNNPQSERYGLPEEYNIGYTVTTVTSPTDQSGATKGEMKNLIVHWSRVIHIAEGLSQNEIYGEPRLRNPYNRLVDVEKLAGGAAEMFWLGGRPGYVAQMQTGDDGYQWDENDPSLTDMKDQIEEYEHKLRRWLTVAGVDIKALETQIASPKDHMDMLVQNISASSQIPKRILVGSERGELASSQDQDNWDDVVDSRRQWFITPCILEPLIERLIDYKVLPEPEGGEYNTEWPSLRESSPKEKAEVGEIRARAIKEYLSAPGGTDLLPWEDFLRTCMGFDEETIHNIQQRAEDQMGDEVRDIEEAADIESEEESKLFGKEEGEGQGEGDQE